MSDVTHPQGLTRTTTARREATTPPHKLWPLVPYGFVVAGGTIGLLVGRAIGGESDDFESRLLLLLRFMAVMKAVGVFAAAGLTHWRLSHPIAPRLAWSYGATLAIMAVAVGLIWSLGAIAIGAVLFHVGLLGFLLLAWKDDGARFPHRA